MNRSIDITGQRFGGLVAIRRVAKSHLGWTWELRCDCGATVKRLVAILRQQSKAGRYQHCVDCARRRHAAQQRQYWDEKRGRRMTHRRKEWKPHFVLYEECEEFRPHDVHYEEREVAALRDELELELGFRADRELAGLA